MLATISRDTRAGDLFEALAESEYACLREEIGDEFYQLIGRQSILVLVSSEDLISPSCLEPQRKSDIIVAVMSAAVGGLPGEAEACIRNEIIETYNEDSSGGFLYGPYYLNCLTQAQTIELGVSETVWRARGASGETRDCIRQANTAAFGTAERLGSGNPQHSMGITLMFHEPPYLAA